jgi:hypothetical protein
MAMRRDAKICAHALGFFSLFALPAGRSAIRYSFRRPVPPDIFSV